MTSNNERKEFNRFFNELNLYGKEEININNIDFFERIFRGTDLNQGSTVKINSYCIYCSEKVTFKLVNENIASGYFYDDLNSRIKDFPMFTSLEFKCLNASTDDHIYYLSIKVDDFSVVKIGQFPSVNLLQAASIQKYKFLLEEDYAHLYKALSLYSQNIGIGSFVYLRRIFEKMIEEKKFESIENGEHSENELENLRMETLIKKFSNYLPEYIVKNREIYKILNEGLHNLSEEKCLVFFPVLKTSIELILDQKLSDIDTKRKIAENSKNLSRVLNSINNPQNDYDN